MKLSNIQGVIIDWAGTTIDYGSFAPVAAFIDAFSQFEIEVNSYEIRQFMGYAKKDHTREILNLERVSQLWFEKYKRRPTEDDVEQIFKTLSSSLNKVVIDYTEPIDGAIDFLEKMRLNNIKVGSTTGYVREMMNEIIDIAAKKGFQPDCIITPTEVPIGRPYPWMCYLNAIQLQIYPMYRMIKIGDTVADIQEGINAGMWTIGITKSGNEVGLTLEEIKNIDKEKIDDLIKNAEQKLINAGAHYIIEGIWDIDKALEDIENKISKGLKP